MTPYGLGNVGKGPTFANENLALFPVEEGKGERLSGCLPTLSPNPGDKGGAPAKGSFDCGHVEDASPSLRMTPEEF